MDIITNPYMAMSLDFLLYQLEENKNCNPAECARICQELRRRRGIEKKGKRNAKKQ